MFASQLECGIDGVSLDGVIQANGLVCTIHISIDGLTQKTYESYRVHGTLSKVIEGAKLLVEAKKAAKSATPHLIFQFLVVKPNEHEIDGVFYLHGSATKNPYFQNYIVGIYPLLGYPAI